MNGQAIMANGVIFPGTWAYYDGLQPVTYDREKAVEMLKEAEWTVPADGQPIREKEGVQFTFDLLYPDDDLHAQIAESIQRDWSQLDIQVNIVPVAYDQLINENLVNREYQAALVDLNLSRSPDPDPYPFWDQAQATGGQNYTQWDDRNASDYIEQARVAYDINERAVVSQLPGGFNEQLTALRLLSSYTLCSRPAVQGSKGTLLKA
jgi:peptide/nickel transport system substrate-binding protein